MAKAVRVICFFIAISWSTLIPQSVPAQEPDSVAVSSPASRRGVTMYKGPMAYRDPTDPFQRLRWASGQYVPKRLRLKEDRSSLEPLLEYDLETSRILLSYHTSSEQVLPSVGFDRSEYSVKAINEGLRQSWTEDTKNTMGHSTNQGQGGLLNVALPWQVPFTEKLFGPGAPRLAVSGSENIEVSGTSTWRVGQKGDDRTSSSIFPRLDMRQRLNVNLSGQIGTKLFIDVAQNSEALTPLENSMKIRYRAEHEDEVLRSVELGNTSLTLPRTQFVTSAGRAEGLFGVKADARVGDVNITAIASRQEGEPRRKVFGEGEGQVFKFFDVDYIGSRFFFFEDPDSAFSPVLVDTSVRVFLFDADNSVTEGKVEARAYLDPNDIANSPFKEGQFRALEPEKEFSLHLADDLIRRPFLELTGVRLSENQMLAVTYEKIVNNRSVRVGNPQVTPLELKMLRPKDTDLKEGLADGVWGPVRRLEMKNIYSLGGGDDFQNLRLTIFYKAETQEISSIRTSSGREVSATQILGLDQIHNESGERTPDGFVDPEYIRNGLLFFPDLRPFDPSDADVNGNDFRGRSWPPLEALEAERPDTLGWTKDDAGNPVPVPDGRFKVSEIYEKKQSWLRRERPVVSKYRFEMESRTLSGVMRMDGFGTILEGSETVRKGGTQLTRGTDYSVDYLTGEITLKEPALPNETVEVTWSEDSPFSQGSRSLMGTSLYYAGSERYNWSTSWLHESRGLPDPRPRVGQESTKITVGDLSGQLNYSPWLLTDIMDALPGIRTNAPSSLQFTGAVGLSMPNPNTKGQVWVDDMEGTRQLTSSGLRKDSWSYSSLPGTQLTQDTYSIQVDDRDVLISSQGRGRLLWFNPSYVRQRERNPFLDDQKANQELQTMELLYVPTAQPDVMPEQKWSGLVTTLAAGATDLNKAQYIEVWVNDFVPHERAQDRRGEIRIDLGQVSEDAVWDPLEPPAGPDGVLNLEDRLTSDGTIAQEEDNGLDETPDGQEPYDENKVWWLDRLQFGDNAGDNRRDIQENERPINDAYKWSRTTIIRNLAGINGTEDNQEVNSEDLNRDRVLDTDNNYFEYVIDLSDSAFIDVTRDYPEADWGNYSARDGKDYDPSKNGWRMYRIPVLDKERIEVGAADLGLTQHMRMWFRGIDTFAAQDDTLHLQIAGVDVVSNRWERLPVLDAGGIEVPDTTLELTSSEYQVGVVNTDETRDYVPPFVLDQVNGIRETENSVSLDLENLQPGHEFRARRPFPDVRDFTQYRDVRFYINPRRELAGTWTEPIEFFLRFSSNSATDSLQYYELVTAIEPDDPRLNEHGWLEFEIPFLDLTKIKEQYNVPRSMPPDSFLVGPFDDSERPRVDLVNGLKTTIRGAPTFSKVAQMSMGLRNTSGQIVTGSMWVNDIRMGNVRRDMGWTARASMNMNMGGVLALNGALTMHDEDFRQLGDLQGLGSQATNFNVGAVFQSHKFVERTGLVAPIRFGYGRTKTTPKYQVNSDIELTGVLPGTVSETEDINASMTLGRTPLGRSGFLTRYLIDPMTMNTNMRRNSRITPDNVDTTWTQGTSINYGLRLSPLAFNILGMRTFLLPRSLNLGWSTSRTERSQYRRDLDNPDSLRTITAAPTKARNLRFDFTYNPIQPITLAHIRERDLLDGNWLANNLPALRPQERLFGVVPIGRETSRRNTLSFNYAPSLTRWLTPRFTWTSGYAKASAANLTREGYEQAGSSVDNNNRAGLGLSIPIGRFIQEKIVVEVDRNRARPQAPETAQDMLAELERKEREAREQVQRQKQAAEDSTATEAPSDSAAALEEPKRSMREQLSIFFTDILKLNDIAMDGAVDRSTRFNSVHGDPGLLYQLGLSRDPGLGTDLRPITTSLGDTLFGSSERRGFGMNANTRVTLVKNIGVDLRFSHNNSSSRTNSLTGVVQKDTTWPEMTFNLAQVQNRVPLLSRVFTEFRAGDVRYSRVTRISGDGENPNRIKSVTSNWSPLIRIDGTLRGGWRTSLSLTKSSTVTTNTTTSNVSTSTASSFGFNNTYTKKFTRTNKNGALRDIDYTLDLGYRRNSRQTLNTNGLPSNPRQSYELTLTNRAMVQFTRRVAGTFNLGFTQNREAVSGFTTRSLRVGFATGFNF